MATGAVGALMAGDATPAQDFMGGIKYAPATEAAAVRRKFRRLQ
jgi:hypothetical protein